VRKRFAPRVVAAVVLIGALAGTVAAASPSPSGSPSPAASEEPSASAAPSQVPSASASVEPSVSPSPAASEEPKESAKPGKSPEAGEDEDSGGPLTAEAVAHFVERLKAAGITTTASAFKALADKVGAGGAVRTLAFAKASGKTPAQILAMRESGMGWGRIVRELNLSIGPGIGWIMGHGGDNSKAP
jgi:hypothetical protein